jgi:hypothetical protein
VGQLKKFEAIIEAKQIEIRDIVMIKACIINKPSFTRGARRGYPESSTLDI